MSGAYELTCPSCRETFEIDEDDDICHADDVADESTTPCPGCGVALVVVAYRDVYFEVELAAEAAGGEE